MILQGLSLFCLHLSSNVLIKSELYTKMYYRYKSIWYHVISIYIQFFHSQSIIRFIALSYKVLTKDFSSDKILNSFNAYATWSLRNIIFDIRHQTHASDKNNFETLSINTKWMNDKYKETIILNDNTNQFVLC